MRRLSCALLGLLILVSACSPGEAIRVATFTPLPGGESAPPELTQTPAQAGSDETNAPTDAGLPKGALILDELRMLDALNGWALGRVSGQAGALLLRTADSGYTWQSFTPAGALGEDAVWHLLGSEELWAVFNDWSGGLTVWRSQDGGLNWTALPVDSSGLELAGAALGQITFVDRLNGWLLLHLPGAEGRDPIALFRTYNGGEAWSRVVDPTLDNLPGVCRKTGLFFLTDLLGWVTGDCTGAIPGLYLFQSGDGGKTWAQISLPNPPDQPGLFDEPRNQCGAEPPLFFNPQEGILRVFCKVTGGVGERAWLYRTFNGGSDWSAAALPAANGSLAVVDILHAWLLSGPGADGMYRIQASEDGGLTWRDQTPVSWTGELDFITWTVGWGLARLENAFGLVKTTNGGQTWEQIPLRLAER